MMNGVSVSSHLIGNDMAIAFWCIKLMVIYPYIFAGLAKSGGRYDNHNPRDYLEKTSGWRRRANFVQMNGFEALPAFVAAVFVAHTMEANQATIDIFCQVFVGARIAYGIFYLIDWAVLRSIAWLVGFICVLGLFSAGKTPINLLF